MTYALRGCHRALLASSKPGLASCSQVADGGDRWQLMAVRGHVGDTGPQCVGHVLGGTALSNDLPLQAGHIPSWRRSCECYALWPVAAVSGWLLLLLSATADSEVRPGPRPQTLRPHQVKTPQAGPRSEDYLHPPCRLGALGRRVNCCHERAQIIWFCLGAAERSGYSSRRCGKHGRQSSSLPDPAVVVYQGGSADRPPCSGSTRSTR